MCRKEKKSSPGDCRKKGGKERQERKTGRHAHPEFLFLGLCVIFRYELARGFCAMDPMQQGTVQLG